MCVGVNHNFVSLRIRLVLSVPVDKHANDPFQELGPNACPYQESDPNIGMVESAEFRHRRDGAAVVNGPSRFAAGFMFPEEAEPGPMPSHYGLGPHDGDRPQNAWLNAIEDRKKQTVPTSKLWPMTNLALKHSHLMVERQVVSLCRRPDNNTPDQTPDNGLQEIKHCRRIVARSINQSRPKGRMRFLVGTGWSPFPATPSGEGGRASVLFKSRNLNSVPYHISTISKCRLCGH